MARVYRKRSKKASPKSSGFVDKADVLAGRVQVEMTVLGAWRDSLTGVDHEKERLWCEERSKELQALSFDTDDADNTAVLRLSPVIPVVAKPPTAEVQSPDPDSNGG